MKTFMLLAQCILVDYFKSVVLISVNEPQSVKKKVLQWISGSSCKKICWGLKSSYLLISAGWGGLYESQHQA